MFRISTNCQKTSYILHTKLKEWINPPHWGYKYFTLLMPGVDFRRQNMTSINFRLTQTIRLSSILFFPLKKTMTSNILLII